MPTDLHPEVILRKDDDQQPELELFAEGIRRYVWEGKFGPMLIEVRDGEAFVNGERVTPAGQHMEP